MVGEISFAYYLWLIIYRRNQSFYIKQVAQQKSHILRNSLNNICFDKRKTNEKIRYDN